MIAKEREAGHLTRRDFLKTVGLATGALAFPSALPTISDARAEVAPWREGVPLRVAVLVPSSGIYPSLAEDLISGLRLHFGQARASGGQAVRLVMVDVGIGEGQAQRSAEELLKGDVDLAVGFVSPRLAASLGEVFKGHDRAFVAIDSGADVVRRDDRDPGFFDSLFLWQSERAFGEWAAGELGRRAVVAASAYDSGFDAHHAFQLGFEGAGGVVLAEHVTHHPGGDSGLFAALSGIKETEPDFVYAAYCGRQAVEFGGAYARAGLRGIPLAGSGFLTDESILNEQGATAVGIKTCLSWAAGLENAGNRRFVSTYRKQVGREPGALAALGYETARMISGALDAAGGDPSLEGRFGDALANAGTDGPRGRVTMGSDGREINLYVREVRQSSRRLSNAVVAGVGPAVAPEGQLTALRDGLKTGWLNTYLSV
jgi:branched-chain amino acid transport system substrate-binding protein